MTEIIKKMRISQILKKLDSANQWLLILRQSRLTVVTDDVTDSYPGNHVDSVMVR